MEPNTTDNSVPREITALLSDERLILRETKRAMTPFGGVAVFVALLRKIDLIGKIRQCMPVCWRSLSRYGFSWREQAVERRSGTGDDAGR